MTSSTSGSDAGAARTARLRSIALLLALIALLLGAVEVATRYVVEGSSMIQRRMSEERRTVAAVHRAEGVQLLQKYAAQPGFLFQLAARRFVHGFIDAHEAARQRPLALERRKITLDEHDFQIILIEAEHDAIDGKRATGIFVSEGHGWLLYELV